MSLVFTCLALGLVEQHVSHALIVELIIMVYVLFEPHEHSWELEYALYIGVEVLWCNKVSEGKSCIWIENPSLSMMIGFLDWWTSWC